MARNKEEEARREGMAYALRVAKEKGIEGLEKELEFRNATNIPIKVSQKMVDDFVQETKEATIDTVCIMSMYALRDEFGFGPKRLNQYKKRFNDYTDSLVGGYMEWKDIVECIHNETGIELHIRSTDERLSC